MMYGNPIQSSPRAAPQSTSRPQQSTKIVYSKAGAVSPRGSQMSVSHSPREQVAPRYSPGFKQKRLSMDIASMNEDISVSLNQKLIDETEPGVVLRPNYPPQPKKPAPKGEPIFDLKQFRLVASDFLLSPVLQNLFAKLWNLMITYNYDRAQIEMHKELLLQIPLRMDIYRQFEPLFSKGLGSLYQTSQLTCSHASQYPHKHVLFQRFCFDFISLSGHLLYQLTLHQYEYLIRKVFSLLTYYDEGRAELCFRRIEDIGGVFDGTNVITKDVVMDITTTQWSKRKVQIKEEYLKSQAQEQVHTQKMTKQIELAMAEEAPQEFDSLINLSLIAEKAKEELIKREAKLRRSQEKTQPKPFLMTGVQKEDLNIVLQKDVADIGKLMDGPVQSKQSFYATQNLGIIAPGRISHLPHQTQSQQARRIQKIIQVSKAEGPPQSQQSQSQPQVEEELKQVLMYKQLVAMSKNQEEESDNGVGDSDKKEQERARTPELIDTSESEMDEEPQEGRRSALTPVGGTRNDHHKGSIETERRASQQVDMEEALNDPMEGTQGTQQTESAKPGIDSQFVKYVWNKKTKRMEMRDIRHTVTLNSEEMRKFQHFSRINEKSKVLCMQLDENYLNTTVLPQAIAGACEVNFKEIQEEQLYAPNDLKKRYMHQTSPLRALNDIDYQQLPAYKKHLVNAQALKEGKPNMLNKKRRASIENKTVLYASKPGDLPSAKEAQEKLVLPPRQVTHTEQELVNQKLSLIRNALRGGSLVTRDPIYEDYLQNCEHQTAVSVAAQYNQNAAFFNSQASTMQATAMSQFAPPQQRAQSLLQTRELFMRSKIHAVQLMNKKAIQSQRDQLKSSMYQTQMTQFTAHDVLPHLEATQARIYRQANMHKTRTYGKYTSPSQVNQGRTSKESKTPSLLSGSNNLQGRLQLQNGSKTRTSMIKAEASSKNPISPRSSNNNMDIIEYGVLSLANQSRVAPHRDQLMVVTGEEEMPQGYTTLIKTAPYANNKAAAEKNISRIQQAMAMTQNDNSRFRSGGKAQQFNNSSREDTDSYDPLCQLGPFNNRVPYNRDMAFSALGGHTTKYSMGQTSVMGHQQPQKKTFINQLPMQDFHLEEWRTAYKNINSATRHFYTGSSYPALVKL